MLINETIKIKVYSQMIKYYKNLNYNVTIKFDYRNQI